MLERDVAPGIHRVEDSYTNWYLVEDGGRLTIVDAGVPTSWSSLLDALRELGRRPGDVDAVVLTHAHFDHIGMAERARRELGVPVWVHENDVPLTRHPTQYAHERSPFRYLATYPKALPCIASFARTRAFFPKPIAHVRRYADGTLDVPGAPAVVPTAGHTLGHCALFFADRDAVIAGDAVVTFNPYTGRSGPQLVARAANADTERALASLDALAALDAGTVLTGHGAPWRDGTGEIVRRARAAGVQ
jgi:glyoxylase-like metal-dependent hydrolase (beta-lactamase superfamily II)